MVLRDERAFLSQYDEHIFIFSSAGKPIFTRYGEESLLNALFGLLQVLMGTRQCSLATSSSAENSDPVRRIAFRAPTHSKGSQSEKEIKELYVYFRTQEELTYVMTTHQDSISRCWATLDYLHWFMLSVQPTVSTCLRSNASYDVRRLYSETDFDILRDLIDNLSTSPHFYLCAVPSVSAFCSSCVYCCINASHCDHTAMRRTGVQDYIKSSLETLKKEAEKEKAENGNFILSLFLVDGSLGFACVANDSLLKDINTPDVLLLMHFAFSVYQRQHLGETWAPLCLPLFNRTGYVWCYSSALLEVQDTYRSFSTEPNALGGKPSTGHPRGVTTRNEEFDKKTCFKGPLFIQVSASQEDFPRLSNRASRLAYILTHDVSYTNFFTCRVGRGMSLPRISSSFSEGFCHAGPPCLKHFLVVMSHSGLSSHGLRRNPTHRALSDLLVPHLFCLNPSSDLSSPLCSADNLSIITRAREDWNILKSSGKSRLHVDSIFVSTQQPCRLNLFLIQDKELSVVLLSHPTPSLLALLCQYRVRCAVGKRNNNLACGVPSRNSGRESRSMGQDCNLRISELIPSFSFSKFTNCLESEVREVFAIFTSSTSLEVMFYWTLQLLHAWVIGVRSVKQNK